MISSVGILFSFIFISAVAHAEEPHLVVTLDYSDVEVKQGQSHLPLTCHVEDSKLHWFSTVVWTRRDVNGKSSVIAGNDNVFMADERYTVEYEVQEDEGLATSTLNIHNLQSSDAGEYACIVQEENEEASDALILKVI